jgi:hypothetical protein
MTADEFIKLSLTMFLSANAVPWHHRRNQSESLASAL